VSSIQSASDPVLARGHRVAVPVDRDAVANVGVAQEHLDQVALRDGQLRAGHLPVLAAVPAYLQDRG